MGLGRTLPSWALLALLLVTPLAAQEMDIESARDTAVAIDARTDSLVAAAVSMGSGDASLDLHLSDGRTVQFELAGGNVRVDGQSLGRYDEGGSLERSWRDLLDEAAVVSTGELPTLLREWAPPTSAGQLGERLDARLEEALEGVGGRMVVARRSQAPAEDSIERLLARIDRMEQREEERRDRAEHDGWTMPGPLHDLFEGLGELLGVLVWFGVMFGVGAALVFFGDGRLERVSQTVRDEPIRSGLIGLAGAFLSIPFYVLVILALVISILGIPLVIAWAPLFPMLVTLAAIGGWIAVAYAAGDGLVRRKLSERPRFQNAGPFQSLAVGVALLLSPFALGSLFTMTSVLEWLGGILYVLGLLANILVAAIGFGAVLVRGAAGFERHREQRAARRRARLAAELQEGTNV